MDKIPAILLITVISSFILVTTNCQDASFSSQRSASASATAGDANKVAGDAGQIGAGVRPTFGPDVITRVNNGVSTILGGVWKLSLEDILRGSFMFTRNENVRSVAFNVLDNVFQPQRGGGGQGDNANANAISQQARTG